MSDREMVKMIQQAIIESAEEVKEYVKQSNDELRTELKTDIAELRTELKADIAALSDQVRNLENHQEFIADKVHRNEEDIFQLNREFKQTIRKQA